MDTKQAYEAVAFDSKYNDEDRNQRYTRLLQAFDEKFAKIRSDLPRAVPHENKEDLLPPINKYIKELYKLRDNIDFLARGMEEPKYVDLRTKKSKQASVSDALVVEDHLTKKYLIEVLARSITALDTPNDDENKIQLILLAKEIPEDTQGYWPHLKIGIIFFVTEAAALGIILGGVGIAASLAAPPVAALVLVLLSIIPMLAASYLIVQEADNIFRPKYAEGIGHAISSSQGTLFHPDAKKPTEADDSEENKDNSNDGTGMGPNGSD
ncbi:MAG: hypothetical protein P1U36_00870 [Legionellaceae bacterium]|nr:hypothetical protein [Legionellaceae bacterium]